jgi:hypothetical protein
MLEDKVSKVHLDLKDQRVTQVTLDLRDQQDLKDHKD